MSRPTCRFRVPACVSISFPGWRADLVSRSTCRSRVPVCVPVPYPNMRSGYKPNSSPCPLLEAHGHELARGRVNRKRLAIARGRGRPCDRARGVAVGDREDFAIARGERLLATARDHAAARRPQKTSRPGEATAEDLAAGRGDRRRPRDWARRTSRPQKTSRPRAPLRSREARGCWRPRGTTRQGEAAVGDLAAGRGDLAAGRGDLAAGRGDLAAGRGDLAAGRGDLAAGRGDLAAGRGDLAAGPSASSRTSRPGDAWPQVPEEEEAAQTKERVCLKKHARAPRSPI
ncbi:uncharacterized protein LOC121980210 [Zingiber officinale]|uniref:uncharacterized protein LOC121980210 n=1 Tax=Zingiber officinale TaxID=94328 RepID=UPI001C4B1DC2|nr:uncharacterized protein LOC121980210 [Zingiber officinale]